MKKIFFFVLVGSSLLSQAQNFSDALRLSRSGYAGNARYTGMSGSFGALGGDISALSDNPGGIGVYRNSEFTFSTALSTFNTGTTFRDNSNNGSSVRLTIPNIGFVSTYKGNPDGFKNYSFAIAHNRMANFHKSYTIKGTSRQGSSYLDRYVNQLNQDLPEYDDLYFYNTHFFGPAQAYIVYAINEHTFQDGTLGYIRGFEGEEAIDQTKEVESWGRQSETFFTFGGNFQDKLYIGASLGIQESQFEQEIRFTETYQYTELITDSIQLLDYSEFTYLDASGLGLNLKAGLIYRVNDMLRLGAAIHTPTYYRIYETFYVDAESNSTNADPTFVSTEGPVSEYEYKLRTPLRLQTSLALVVAKNALLNVDYQFADYGSSRFDDTRHDRFDYSDVNEGISRVLEPAHMVRFGGEYRLDPFAIRAGVRYDSNPYTHDLFLNPTEDRFQFSLGGGFRQKNYNIDLSYINTNLQQVDPMYATSDASATIDHREHLVTLSVGWKW